MGLPWFRADTNLPTHNKVLELLGKSPKGKAVVSLEHLQPVFVEVPGKEHFFEETLAKTGASDKVQIYGEIGLEYGSELAHGIIRGLPV